MLLNIPACSIGFIGNKGCGYCLIPACEGIACAGGNGSCERLTVGIGHNHLIFGTVAEHTAVRVKGDGNGLELEVNGQLVCAVLVKSKRELVVCIIRIGNIAFRIGKKLIVMNFICR